MKILKEIIISLLSCFLILLILGVVFYRFIPKNKIVPETIKYQASQEVQSEINSEVDSNSNKIIKTYEITASDLEKYQKNKDYDPGKNNPFAPITDEEDISSTGNGGDTNTSQSNGSTNNSGSLFEKPGSK